MSNPKTKTDRSRWLRLNTRLMEANSKLASMAEANKRLAQIVHKLGLVTDVLIRKGVITKEEIEDEANRNKAT